MPYTLFIQTMNKSGKEGSILNQKPPQFNKKKKSVFLVASLIMKDWRFSPEIRHRTVTPVFSVFTQHVARNCDQYNWKNVIQDAYIEMEEIKLSFCRQRGSLHRKFDRILKKKLLKPIHCVSWKYIRCVQKPAMLNN